MKKYKILSGISIALGVIILILSYISYNGLVISKVTNLSEFGCWIGGILGPFFALAGFFMIYGQFNLQSEEIKSNKLKIKKEKNRDILLKMISDYRNMVNTITSRQYCEFNDIEMDVVTKEVKRTSLDGFHIGELKQYVGRIVLSIAYNDLDKNVKVKNKVTILQYYFKNANCEITDMFHFAKSIVEFIYNKIDDEEKNEYIELFKGHVTLYEVFFILISGIKKDYENLVDNNTMRKSMWYDEKEFGNIILKMDKNTSNLRIFREYDFFEKLKMSYDGHPVFEHFEEDF